MESNVEKELQEYKKFKETFCFTQKEIVQKGEDFYCDGELLEEHNSEKPEGSSEKWINVGYKLKGAANKGIAMFVKNMFDDNEIFYEQMAKVKTELRETIEKRRGYVTFLYMGQDPWFTFKDKRERLSQLRTHENKTVDIAFINSIHLEDKDLFERDACSKFIFESGIMNRENIVYLEQLKENYLIKMPQINEREV